MGLLLTVNVRQRVNRTCFEAGPKETNPYEAQSIEIGAASLGEHTYCRRSRLSRRVLAAHFSPAGWASPVSSTSTPWAQGPWAQGPKIFVKISLLGDVGFCIKNCCQTLWEYFPPIPDPISPISDQNLPDFGANGRQTFR